MILDNGSDKDFNNDITQKHGVCTTNTFDVQIGQHLDHIDFGYLPLVDIGDFCGKILTIMDCKISMKRISKTSVYLWNEGGNLVDSTMTNANGKFAFTKFLQVNTDWNSNQNSQILKAPLSNPLNNDKNSKDS